MQKKVEVREWTPWDRNPTREFLRSLTAAYYDWQHWAISAKLRGIRRSTRALKPETVSAFEQGETEPDDAYTPRDRGPRPGHLPPVELTDSQLRVVDTLADRAEKLAADYVESIRGVLPSFGGIYEWLNAQDGLGPVMSGFLLAHLDPYKANRPSSFWKFFGLDVVPGDDGRGHSPHPEKGKKNPYNAMGRAKMLGVLGPGILKACVRNPENIKGKGDLTRLEVFEALYAKGWQPIETLIGPRIVRGSYAQAYFDYRAYLYNRGDRNTNWGYAACVNPGCASTKFVAGKEITIPKKMEDDGRCGKCGGTEVVRAGADKHMTNAAVRRMVKLLLADLWKVMREAEGLPVVPTYHERQTIAERGYPHGGPFVEIPAGAPAKAIAEAPVDTILEKVEKRGRRREAAAAAAKLEE